MVTFTEGENTREEIKNKLRQNFDGKIVRKDLTKKIKEGANVPVYALEFLLGQYCSSDDETVIEKGVQNVKRILADNFVRPDEAQKILSQLRKKGSHTIIDMVTVHLDIKKNCFFAEFSNLGLGNVPIKSRVAALPPEHKHGYIESISFQGGKFDGQIIRFSPELNTLIGIRGSGKSSVLEVIRYMFDLPVQTDKTHKESLIKNIFGSGGKATLTVIDKHGKRYSISRILGERSNVIDENRNDLNVTALSLFDGVQYFGQKDLSNSSDHENGLLEKLVGGKIGQTADVDSSVSELVEAVSQLLDVSKIPEQIEENKTKKSEIEHKMKIYAEKGVAAKLQKQTGYTADRTKLNFVKGKINSAVQAIKHAYDANTNVSQTLQEFKSEYNQDLLKKAADILLLIDS